MSNSLYKFGGSAVSMLTDVQYAALVNAGHVTGIASSALENKALKQASLIAAGIGSFLDDHQSNNINDALTSLNIGSYMETAINNIIAPQLPPAASTSTPGIQENANTSEAQGYSHSSRTITPSSLNTALKGGNQNLVSNLGKQDLPGGLQLRWGVSIGTTSGTLVTFSPAFNNGVFVVLCTDAMTTPPTIPRAFAAMDSGRLGFRMVSLFDGDVAYWLAVGN